MPRLRRWLVPSLVLFLTVLAFLPSLQNGFVNWDDEANLLANARYRGLGWEQLRWMFTTFHMSLYRPLAWVTLGLDYLIWGMEPFGYHLTSLLLHAANAVFFYFLVLRLLTLAYSTSDGSGGLAVRSAAGFAALFFAVHPLRVEPVAWVAARNDVVSGLFFLLTILFYLRATAVVEERPLRWRWMAAALSVYGLSLLAKASGVTLPFVLLALDVYPLRRVGGGPRKWFGPEVRRVWWEKAPFLILAVGAAVVAVIAKYEIGAMKSLDQYDLSSRTIQAFFGLSFYLWKTILPLRLSPLYELPVRLNPWDWPFVLGGMSVLLISIVLVVVRRRWPAGLSSWVCYVVILAPVLGIAQSGPQMVADRYSYLSCLGWATLAGGGLFHCWEARSRGQWGARVSVSARVIAVLLVTALGLLTWRQAGVWRDSERLWRHVLAVGESGLAHNNLAATLSQQGKVDEAIQHYHQSLQFNPDYAEARYNLATILAEQGKLEESFEHFRRALEIDPNHAMAHYNLANTLAQRGRFEDAVHHYREAIRIDPAKAEAHGNLGNVHLIRGDLEKAAQEYLEALRINPTLIETRFNLALILIKGQRFEEAKREFQQIVERQPEFAEARYHLGNLLIVRGEVARGIDQLKEAVRLEPRLSEGHAALARVLAAQGRREEAAQHYQEALRILKTSRQAPAGGR